MNPPSTLSDLISGYRSTTLIVTAVRLGLPDALQKAPATASQLAEMLKAKPDPLHRLLRGLAVLGLVHEDDGGLFSVTEAGSGLCSDAPDSLHGLALLTGEEYLPAWQALEHSIRTGGPAFSHVFGMDAWEHRRRQPVLREAFDTMLRAQTAALARSILDAWDFCEVREAADIGGGHGGLLSEVLAAHPHLRGVLFDLEEVIAEAGSQMDSVTPRLRLVSGDFFQEVVSGPDLYLLKSVLHDWNDTACLRILQVCRAAMAPGARLLVIERALPDRAVDDPGTVFLDLHMLAMLGGRERTAAEYQSLAAHAGLAPGRQIDIPSGFILLEFTLPS